MVIPCTFVDRDGWNQSDAGFIVVRLDLDSDLELVSLRNVLR